MRILLADDGEGIERHRWRQYGEAEVIGSGEGDSENSDKGSDIEARKLRMRVDKLRV